MKCIRYSNGTTVRVANEAAMKHVSDGKAVFTSKRNWRTAGGEYEGPAESEGKRSIHPPRGWDNRSNKKPRWARW